MVRTLAHEAVGDGVLDRNEARYIEQIFNFSNRTVEEVMTPRSNVFFLPIDTPVMNLVEEIRRSQHTKIPLYRQHRDEVEGILYVRDLLKANLRELVQQPEKLSTILHEPYFVPETKSVSELFRTFRNRRLSVALAVDEYGGVTGLISMEDVLECIYGEIPSLSETLKKSEAEVLEDGSIQVDGAMSIEQFKQESGIELSESEFDTIGGFVIHEFGELPPESASIDVGDLVFTVQAIEANRIKTLLVKKSASDPA